MTDPRSRGKLIISNMQGLSAGAAARLAKAAHKFEADIHVQCDGNRVDAKSILALLSLRVVKGTQVTLTARGPDAGEAVLAIKTFFTAAPADKKAVGVEGAAN